MAGPLIGFRILGLEAMIRKVQGAQRRVPDAIEQAMRQVTLIVAGRAQKNITGSRATNPPHVLGRVTGRLAGSITTRVSRRGPVVQGRVGTNVVYGPPHELGLGRMPRRPYLAPALDASQKNIRDMLGRAFVGAVRGG